MIEIVVALDDTKLAELAEIAEWAKHYYRDADACSVPALIIEAVNQYLSPAKDPRLTDVQSGQLEEIRAHWHLPGIGHVINEAVKRLIASDWADACPFDHAEHATATASGRDRGE